MTALLATRNLESFYGDFQALFGVDFEIAQGEIVAIIGANGAGKSTFLKTVAGLLKAKRDAVAFEGEPIGGMPAGKIVQRGVALVPEGRRLFPSLSVEENLLMGAYTRRPGPWNLESVYALFPILAEKRRNPGTALSGGQQSETAHLRRDLARTRPDRRQGNLRRTAERLRRRPHRDHRRAGRERGPARVEPALLPAGRARDVDGAVEGPRARADLAGVLRRVAKAKHEHEGHEVHEDD